MLTMIALVLAISQTALVQTGGPTVDAATTLPEIAVTAERAAVGPEAPQEEPRVVCETRAVTGSRFRRRVCTTRYYAQTMRSQARDYMAAAQTGVSPGDVSSGPSTGPQ